jgi:hypothetical protein
VAAAAVAPAAAVAAAAVAAAAVAAAAVAAAAMAAAAPAGPEGEVGSAMGASHFEGGAGGGWRSGLADGGATKQHRCGQHAGAHHTGRGVADRTR